MYTSSKHDWRTSYTEEKKQCVKVFIFPREMLISDAQVLEAKAEMCHVAKYDPVIRNREH